MSAEQTLMNPMELGVVCTSLIVVWKALDVAKTMFLANRVPIESNQSGYDTVMRQRIKDIHSHTDTMAMQIAKGDLGCKWKDRDEVSKSLVIAERQVEATQSMVDEMRLLRQELVLTRNGKS